MYVTKVNKSQTWANVTMSEVDQNGDPYLYY